jgi:hypothetical protein
MDTTALAHSLFATLTEPQKFMLGACAHFHTRALLGEHELIDLAGTPTELGSAMLRLLHANAAPE